MESILESLVENIFETSSDALSELTELVSGKTSYYFFVTRI